MGFDIARRPEWRPKRKFDEQRARRPDILRDFTAHIDAYCRDASFFYNARNQSHGLLADRSTRHQQRRLCADLEHSLRSSRRSLSQ